MGLIVEDVHMDPVEEFHKHADECRRMARWTSDPQSRDTWKHMAERWLRCAAEFERAKGEAKNSTSRRHRNARRSPLEVRLQGERREELRH
jgi:hypothetical protein